MFRTFSTKHVGFEGHLEGLIHAVQFLVSDVISSEGKITRGQFYFCSERGYASSL